MGKEQKPAEWNQGKRNYDGLFAGSHFPGCVWGLLVLISPLLQGGLSSLPNNFLTGPSSPSADGVDSAPKSVYSART